MVVIVCSKNVEFSRVLKVNIGTFRVKRAIFSIKCLQTDFQGKIGGFVVKNPHVSK